MIDHKEIVKREEERVTEGSVRQDTPEVQEKDEETGKASQKKKGMKILKYGFLVLVVIFLARYFYKNADSYKNLDVDINWMVFAGAVVFYFLYKITLASLWHYMTRLNHCGIRYFKAITAYLYSILGKYIPGKVFMLLARIPAYEEAGAPIRKVTICFFLENICTLLGAAFLFLISLLFFPNDILADYQWATVVLVIVFFICINPKIINFFLKFAEKIIKKKDLVIPITYPEMLKVVVLFILNWIIVGIGFYMLTCSIYPIPASELLYTAGIFGLSCIIGILAIFAPSGLGVREGILVLGLGLIMPEEYAVIISIVSRLWMTVSELALIGIAFIVNKVMERQKRRKGNVWG